MAAGTHLRHGTATTTTSLVTASIPDPERAVRALYELVDDGLLAGINLEGPWLSPRKCGAHDRALLRAPTRCDIERLQTAARERCGTHLFNAMRALHHHEPEETPP